MHDSSMNLMRQFAEKYLHGEGRTVYDIGSRNVNPGSPDYRGVFQRPGWRYVGVDMEPGNNVDIVLSRPYDWREIPSRSADCVISGQMLEHVEFFWMTFLEIKRILRPGGLCCVIAPSTGPEHRYPVDCYRFYPDGMRAAASFAGLEALEAFAQWDEERYPSLNPLWHDCVLIGRRPEAGFARDVKFEIRSGAMKLFSRRAVRAVPCPAASGSDGTRYPPPPKWGYFRFPRAGSACLL